MLEQVSQTAGVINPPPSGIGLMFKYLKSYQDKVLIIKNENFLINLIQKIGNSQICATYTLYVLNSSLEF